MISPPVTEGHRWIFKTNQAEFFFVPVKVGEGQGTRIVVDQESRGEGGGRRRRGRRGGQKIASFMLI